ncbi:RND3 [Cordylochernes scorpioides]|uniref:RND3 n=1 Tax=Cordylochernes scorpioides TaxID=51811 RepID=A0ABY6JVA1_9ARAC|nr:RND3 [Cordylochernes scorpioides]
MEHVSPGAEAYDNIRPLAYKDVKVFLVCFAVSEPATLESIINKWYPEIRGHCPGTPVILCGTQSDHRVDRLKSDYRTFVTLEQVTSHPCVIKGRTKSTVHLDHIVYVPALTCSQALAVGRRISAITYVETSAKLGGRSIQDALEVATLAALNRLNQQQQQGGQAKAKKNKGSKVIKKGLSTKARHCTIL